MSRLRNAYMRTVYGPDYTRKSAFLHKTITGLETFIGIWEKFEIIFQAANDDKTLGGSLSILLSCATLMNRQQLSDKTRRHRTVTHNIVAELA